MSPDTRAAVDLIGRLGKPILKTPIAQRTQTERAVTIVLVSTCLTLLAKDDSLTDQEVAVAMAAELNLANDLAFFFRKWGLTPRETTVELIIGVVKES